MAFFKWFAKIEQAQLDEPLHPNAPLEPFNYYALQPNGFFRKQIGKFTSFLFKIVLPATLRVTQRIHPNLHLRFLNFAIVTRDEDVRQVLRDGESFGVPYGPEMNLLGNGTTFALGQDGPEHRRLNKIMRDVIHPEKDMQSIVAQTRSFSEALIENGGGRLDVITDLITRVATETGARYFGVQVDDPKAFAEWSLAASCLLFGDPTGDKKTRRVALNGGRRLCLAIDKSIRLSRDHGTDRGDSIVDRLVARDDIADAEIRATILGMITGFIPTNTLAAGKTLTELLRRPEIFAEARRLATASDRPGVRAIIMEAARLDSALAPGQWRVARKEAVIAPGTSRARTVPQGTVILVSTMTALRDPRRFASPNKFQVDRPVEGDLMFGGGPHACLGRHIATEQLTEIFMVLLSQPELRPANGKLGKAEYVGAFPVRLDMLYRSPASEQNMVTIIVPVLPNITKDMADRQIAKLGHPASAAMRDALDATEIVHFSSLATIESKDQLHLLMELSVDGSARDAVLAIGRSAEGLLRPIFALSGLRPEQDLGAYMADHIVRLHSRPWGATGLNFNGTGEFSVNQIEKQAHLAVLTESIVQEHLARNAYDGSRAMRMLRHVRAVISQDAFLKNQAKPKEDHWDREILSAMRNSKRNGFDAYILKPSRKPLSIAEHEQRSIIGAIRAFLITKEATFVLLPIFGLFALFLSGLWTLSAPPSPFASQCAVSLNWPPHISGCSPAWPEAGLTLLAGASAVLGALLATLLVLALFVGGSLFWLRFKETRDLVDAGPISLEHMKAITKIEDHPKYAQNHIMAVGDLKEGIFRKLTHAFALWAIKMAVVFYYRPGFVINMGTIHYARWFRLPGTDKSVFYSNYNGSWESYLEDFITRARWGQTAVWSNWKGFPTTRFLINKGAEDGDRFKQWVRGKQQVVPFWYSRFPHLTTDHIRNNALIHHGISRARTDSEARDWLRCFGSMPRVHNRIESDEVQSLVFSGLGRYHQSTCLILKLPNDPHKRADWQDLLVGQKVIIRDGDVDARLIDLRSDGLDMEGANRDKDGFASRRVWLKPAFVIGFGDQRPGAAQTDEQNQVAAFLALSAQGLGGYAPSEGKVPGVRSDIPDAFPTAFRMGMTSRSKLLGDFGEAAPKKWHWADTAGASKTPVEAVLLVYGATLTGMLHATSLHRDLLDIFGGEVLDQIGSVQTDKGFGFEHFGFRDGLSQPVIRGTSANKHDTPPRDIVEPGEFILGYENSQGFFPPSPLVRAEADPGDDLPTPPIDALSRFPDFGSFDPSAVPRDFGRNGSFLVIRELAQDVAAFEDHINRTTQQMFLNRLAERESGVKLTADGFDDIERLIGQRPSTEWVAAKMMGRWRDGRPLVGNTVETDIVPALADISNDFAYGIDDPQGLACPFGAHIRRSNPRDSKQPGDALEQGITNRHRLLRRGRLYERPGSEDGVTKPEKGMLFACLCADIERQFEFVQQTWINSPNFHGLSNEPDPIVGTRSSNSRFTIPTPAGPVKLEQPDGGSMNQFVTVRGGGYFFLPSRSALLYLATTLRQ
jgi:cytochrome P450/deferrochelatase/peroxidase EfeB